MKTEIKIRPLLLVFLFCFIFASCSDDDKQSDALPGTWEAVSITEDGEEMLLSTKEQNLKLLIESNGVYRTHTTDGATPETHFGAWSTTEDSWLEMGTDTWHLARNPLDIKDIAQRWVANHLPIRFTILSVNSDELVLRIKTYVGEKKYSSLFVAKERPDVTESNVDEITEEFHSIKTYIFTFKKQK